MDIIDQLEKLRVESKEVWMEYLSKWIETKKAVKVLNEFAAIEEAIDKIIHLVNNVPEKK